MSSSHVACLLALSGAAHGLKLGDFNPFPATETSTFVITSLSSQNLCKAHFF